MRLLRLERCDSCGETCLVVEHAIHRRLLRGDRLLLCRDCGGETHLRSLQELHLLVERRLLCGCGAAQLLRLGPILSNLLFNRGEARRIASNAVCKGDVSLSKRGESGEVDQEVGEGLTGEERPEWRCLVGDVRLPDARGEDRLPCGKVARLLLLLAHQTRDLRIETVHLGFQGLEFPLRLFDDRRESSDLTGDVGERGGVLCKRGGSCFQLRLKVFLLCNERVQCLLLLSKLRGELLLPCECVVKLVGTNR